MKHLKPYKIETVRMEETHRTCDKCQRKIETTSMYDCFSASIIITEGEAYPEGNFSEIKRADFCQDCADAVFNFLKQMGVTFYEYDADDTQTFRKTQI